MLGQGLQLTFGSNVAISVPSFVAAAGNVGWVDEAAPIPVRQLNVLGGPMLTPDKLGVITALTSEMLTGSNAEAMVRDALTQSAALALDTALLDANAGTTTRPAGLRYGIAALTASALADPLEAMLKDIAALAAAVAPVGGNAPIVLVANPVRAMMLRLRAPRELPVAVLASSAVRWWPSRVRGYHPSAPPRAAHQHPARRSSLPWGGGGRHATTPFALDS